MILIAFIVAGFDIDHNELAIVLRLEFTAQAFLVDSRAAGHNVAGS